ncbi:MAG: tetratricopeptide repeat protein [Acidobacteria bacterium]|nr:tetratricopeptide repeat protein [Acidobacteriota bacterium]
MPAATIPGVGEAEIRAIATLGFNLHQRGLFDEAGHIFEGLLALDPGNYLGYAGLGAIDLAHKPPRLEAAVQNLSKAAELNPSDPSVRANLGEAHLRQGEFQKAAAAFHKALELDPEGRDAGANRARAIIEGMDRVIREIEKRASEAQSSSTKRRDHARKGLGRKR